MKKTMPLVLMIILFFSFFAKPVLALPNEKAEAIQHLLDEARRASRAPYISISIVTDDNTYFFSSGTTNDEHTLYELASVSKAFTALGILYLEEEGLLSTTDAIADYLPWLTFYYNGELVDMQSVRIEHFIYHTVGITQNHGNVGVLRGEHADTLQDTVEALIGAELDFLPGERFAYGTKNYNVLGMVIEAASGLSFEEFMRIHIFEPLGLYNTFANRDYAIETGNLAQGYFTQFIFQTRARDSQESRGSVPTGYIISNAYDMARWMQVQLGAATDIPEIFNHIVPISHEGDRTVEPEYMFEIPYYYAFGWSVSQDGTNVSHAGGNPSFAAFVDLHPNENIGVTVLSNSIDVNGFSIATGIRSILDNNLDTSYQRSIFRVIDIVATILTGLGSLLTVLFVFLGFKRKKFIAKPISKKRIALISFLALLTIALFYFAYTLPTMMGVNWRIFLTNFAPLSTLTGMLALILLSSSALFLALRERAR